MLYGDTVADVHMSACACVCTHEHMYMSNGLFTLCPALWRAF